MRRLLGGILVSCLAVAACAAPSPEESAGGASDLSRSTETFDADQLVDDGDILGGADVSVATVQSFLEGKGSILATHEENGVSAAQMIVEQSQAKGVNPVYMLARLQVESSLVEGKGKTVEARLPKATGCGCPDGKACSSEYSGFANQIACASNLIKKYFDQLDAKGKTTSGYAVGTPLKTLDACSVTPKNRATVALYTYTPWVGSFGDGCGSSKYLGSSGVAYVLQKYRTAIPTAKTSTCDGGACTVRTGTTTTTTTTCTPKPAADLCRAVAGTAGTACGKIDDGCGGSVDCSAQPSFGCNTGETCTANHCGSTACVPKSTAELCADAKALNGLACGTTLDGCGELVTCDGVAGFGCSTGSECTDHACVAKKTVVTTPDTETHADVTSQPSPSESTPQATTSTSEREFPNGKIASAGCSAGAPSGHHAEWGGLFAAALVLLGAKRRAARAQRGNS